MSQSLAQILVHIVFSTKQRKAHLFDEIRFELYPYLAGILQNLNCWVLEIGGTDNHIHILCNIPANCSRTEIIGKIKSGSTNWLKKTKKIDNFYWQRGYGIFSVSQSQKSIITNYLKNQLQHHKKFSFEEEFKLMLDKCNIKYDEKYLWD